MSNTQEQKEGGAHFAKTERPANQQSIATAESIVPGSTDPASAGSSERDEQAYLLGRLYWVLEDIWRRGGCEPVLASHFVQACYTPALEFPKAIRRANIGLREIRHSDPALARDLNAQVMHMVARLGFFPERLSIGAQGDFYLGYYHQMGAASCDQVEKQ